MHKKKTKKGKRKEFLKDALLDHQLVAGGRPLGPGFNHQRWGGFHEVYHEGGSSREVYHGRLRFMKCILGEGGCNKVRL